ncbi:hypothetical protein HNQ93_001747 [Hymenobacter luteus]|uniref:Uncharacterized protein n=2 Tax=Hymenobacter TaxID=89966 RepID=A0A7W9T011_9BACT|nr:MULTISPECIES: hypothetical protein [Hymenobacter]MBB4600892.1 hypothetical protein [Hymenobacter latericoloratus]MBB6058901.1 hypothetical protein [Hymenobacter luteus]
MLASEAAQLRIELPPLSDAEARQLEQLAHLLATTDTPPDLRDLAPAVRHLFPTPAYQVGCGGAHIWLHRTADHQRLAIIC